MFSDMNKFNLPGSRGYATVGLFVLTLAVYLLTLPPTITSEDAGLFHMVCSMGGMAHPPGYPLYTSICQVVYRLPFDPVLMGNLLSSVYASLSLCIIFHIARHYVTETAYAFLLAASYGFSLAFWSQAIIVEVYSLNILLFSLVWLLALKYVKTCSTGQFYLLAFCYGLALSNHWPLVVLSTPAIILVLSPVFSKILKQFQSPKFICFVTLSLLAGLSPYLILFFSASPEISIGGELKTWRHVLGYILRTMYADSASGADWVDVVRFIVWITGESLLQLGLIGTAFILAGIVAGFRQLGSRVSFVLILLYAGSTWLLVLIRQVDFNPHIQEVFRPYPLPAYLAICFWYTLGVRWLAGVIHLHAPALSRFMVPVFLLTVFFSNYSQNNRGNERLYDVYGRTILNNLEADSDLFLLGDTQIGIFGYLHHIEKLRSDLNLYSWDGVVFKNRLVSAYEAPDERLNKIFSYINKNQRPAYSISNNFDPFVNYGLYTRAHPLGGYQFLADLDRYLEYIFMLYEQDLLKSFKERRFVFNQLLAFSRQYSGYYQVSTESISAQPPWHVRYQKLMATVPGKLVKFETDLRNGVDISWNDLQDLEALIPDYAASQLVSAFYFNKAEVARKKDLPLSVVIDALEQSLSAQMSNSNPAACLLYQSYLLAGQDRKIASMEKKFRGIKEC